jgi:PAS domain S-box-containing protein
VSNEVPRPRVDTSLLGGLPVPVMVYRGRETLFANQELLNLTGYADFHELSQAGGIDVLFDQDNSNSISDENEIILRDKDGGQIQVKALLQSVPWDDEGALLLSFRLPKHEKLPANEKIVLDMMRVSELHNILDTATDGIIILDPEGIVQSINQPAQALFGRSDEETSGKSVNELFAIESHNRIAEYLSNLGSPDSESLLNDGCEVIGVEAKGGLIPLYVTIGKISASDKYCAILRDMTPWIKSREELVEARKQAEFASEQKTDFLTRVSHEIRTPLNAIIGFSDVMIEERFGPVNNNRYREYLRDINRSGVHVLDLINDLLDISKIEAGKMELSFEAVDLNRIVGETVALLQPQANGDRVLIRTSLSRAVPKVVADARSIRQIVLNLVSNAIKFTSANGQVIVSTVYEGNGEVALRVRDTGRGMSDEEVVVALKPFRQINTISETRGQGTGLGLPLTKALVDANKAYLDIESEPGEGTIVHIQFPTQRVLAD